MAAQQVEHEKQEEELRMLREQRALLKKLLEQQKQVLFTETTHLMFLPIYTFACIIRVCCF